MPSDIEIAQAGKMVRIAKLAQEKLAEQGKKDYNITIMGHASATLPILDK